jgi:hypothetical protein
MLPFSAQNICRKLAWITNDRLIDIQQISLEGMFKERMQRMCIFRFFSAHLNAETKTRPTGRASFAIGGSSCPA